MATSKSISKSRVNFKLHAPEAEQVYVAGSFNEWNPTSKALRLGKDSVWRTWTTLPPGEHEYRFVVDGKWVEDPAVEQRGANPFGSYNSIVSI